MFCWDCHYWSKTRLLFITGFVLFMGLVINRFKFNLPLEARLALPKMSFFDTSFCRKLILKKYFTGFLTVSKFSRNSTSYNTAFGIWSSFLNILWYFSVSSLLELACWCFITLEQRKKLYWEQVGELKFLTSQKCQIGVCFRRKKKSRLQLSCRMESRKLKNSSSSNS